MPFFPIRTPPTKMIELQWCTNLEACYSEDEFQARCCVTGRLSKDFDLTSHLRIVL